VLDRGVDVALCDAQLKHVVATEIKILEGRIARVMRNCAMEVAQLRNYADNELYPRFEQVASVYRQRHIGQPGGATAYRAFLGHV
jgi:hypothetical protein